MFHVTDFVKWYSLNVVQVRAWHSLACTARPDNHVTGVADTANLLPSSVIKQSGASFSLFALPFFFYFYFLSIDIHLSLPVLFIDVFLPQFQDEIYLQPPFVDSPDLRPIRERVSERELVPNAADWLRRLLLLAAVAEPIPEDGVLATKLHDARSDLLDDETKALRAEARVRSQGIVAGPARILVLSALG